MKTWLARIGAALALAVTLGAVIPATAYAGSSGTTTTTQFPGTHFGPMTQKQFRNAEKVINHKFEAAVHAAQAQLIAALIAAHNPGARSTARAQFRLAVIAASSDRDAALVQLGTPPTGTHGYKGVNNGA